MQYNRVTLGKQTKELWAQFNEGTYKPELILAGEMLDRVREHPMALWKCSPKDMAKPQSPETLLIPCY